MLTLYHDGKQYPLENTEYYIRELANGLDEVVFSLPIHDEIYALINEEEVITDRAGQSYKVKQIDQGANDAKIVCQLNIDDWRSTLNVDYNSDTKTCNQQITAVLPAGWTINDRALVNIGRTIEGDLTPYDVCVKCTSVYNVYIRWDNKNKVVTIYPKAMAAPVGAFATRELNLKELNYKGKSNDIVTRLYAYGKDGLSFADINGGKPYVDNFTYTNKIICGIWRDDRYTVAADLLADAQERLEQMAKPVRTYECSIVDLQATNPELYNNLDFSLFTTATLIDDLKENAVDYQVVERHIFPYHPDRNEVIFNSEPLKITTSVVDVVDAIENPSSTFQQIQSQRIASATNWLTSGNGYVVARKGPNGEWKELLFMDTDDEATATQVIRINENGIGFSTNGINGPYTNAWTIDGVLNADFITTGTLDADQVTVHGQIQATSGYIGNDTQGWQIGAESIHNGITSMTDTQHDGTYVGVDGIRFRQNPTDPSPSAETRVNKYGIYTDLGLTATGGVSAGALTANSATINGAVSATGTISTNSGVTASGGISAGGNISASGSISAGGSIGTTDGSIYTSDGNVGTGDGYIIGDGYAGTTQMWTIKDGDGNYHALNIHGGVIVGTS